MDEFWKTFVPLHYVPLTKCCYVVKKHISIKSPVEIVICTIHGQLLEFSERRIVGSCEIPCINVESITLFTTYGYKCNTFYIIKSENEMIIISRQKELKIFKQYKDVEKFLISDFSNVGFPQLGIWIKNARNSLTPNMLVDFKESNEVWSEDGIVSNILNEKYQELTMKVKEYEHKLNIQKELRIHSCEVVDNVKKFHSSSQPLVLLVGQAGSRELNLKENPNKEFTLKIEETWQRTHNGKWVVGITMCNNGERNLQDFNLILRCSDKEKLSYVTKLMMYNDSDMSPPCKRLKFDQKVYNEISDWKEVTILAQNRRAVLIGLLEMPKFISQPEVSLSGFVTCRVEMAKTPAYRIPVPSFQFRVEDYSRSLGSPFGAEIAEADYLCVLMTSYTVTLPVVFVSNFEPSLWKILINELKFIEFTSISCLFHKGITFTELAGIMLHMKTDSPLNYRLTICARDAEQVYLLVHCMYNVLSAPHMIIYPPEVQKKSHSKSINWKPLCKEFELILIQLKKWVMEQKSTGKSKNIKSDLKMAWEEYTKFRAQLSELEMNTDMAL